jgi:hypothetical protein
MANRRGLRLTLTISIVPDQMPMLSFLVSMPSMNSPTTSLSNFYNSFSNIIFIILYLMFACVFGFSYWEIGGSFRLSYWWGLRMRMV